MEIVDSSSTGDITIHNNGVLRLSAGPSITLSNGGLPDSDGKIIITNSAPAGAAYRFIAVSGQSTLTADGLAATLTLIEGNGINITTDPVAGALTNRVTFENTGVVSLTAGAGLTVSASTGAVTISFNNRTDIIGSVFADDSTMLVDGTNGRIVGPVFANVTGDVIGNVTGTLTGNSAGTHTGAVVGNVTGNLTGYQTGDMTGSVFADNSTMLVDGTGGRIVGPVESASVVASSYIQTAVYVDLTAISAALPTPSKGMIVFDDGTNQFRGYDGASWVALN
jgi:hypothetical protein